MMSPRVPQKSSKTQSLLKIEDGGRPGSRSRSSPSFEDEGLGVENSKDDTATQ